MPTITINVPESFACNVRGNPYTVNVTDWAEAGLARVFAYGLQRIHNDATGAVKAEDHGGKDSPAYRDAVLGIAAKMTESLRTGAARTRVVGPRTTTDPVGAEARKMALDVLRNTLAGKRIKLDSLDKAKVNAWVADYLTRNPEVAEKARARVEEKAALAANADIDLDDLIG